MILFTIYTIYSLIDFTLQVFGSHLLFALKYELFYFIVE